MSGESEESPDTFQNLFRLYAQYQYLLQRYNVRQTAIQMQFNPYLVPGFPSMMFDKMSTRFHIVGYVESFGHTFSAKGQLKTQVKLSCCRTLPEFINDVRADVVRFASRVTAAPAELIDEVRIVIQDEDNAEAFYRRLFYGNARRVKDAGAAFRWGAALGYQSGLGTNPVQIFAQSVEASTTQQRAAREEGIPAAQGQGEAAEDTAAPAGGVNPPASSVQTPGPTAAGPGDTPGVPTPGENRAQGPVAFSTNLDPNRELSPREGVYRDAFDSYQVAMQLASRPACSLHDYIRFWHGGMTVGDLLAQGIVQEPIDDFAYDEVQEQDVIALTSNPPPGQSPNRRGNTARKAAIYYGRIFVLRPGPGTGSDRLGGPTAEQRGYTDPPDVQPSPIRAGVPADYPQTRADWDAVLRNYRDNVRRLLRPTI